MAVILQETTFSKAGNKNTVVVKNYTQSVREIHKAFCKETTNITLLVPSK